MKTAKLIITLAAVTLLCAACALQDKPEPSPSATPALSAGAAADAKGGSAQVKDEQPQDEAAEDENNKLYDPSIYVIEASGEWRQEVADGYYADYIGELYLHKLDSSDNRSSSGTYTGFFWMKMQLDAADYIKDMLGNVPMNMDFDAGGEGICDNLAVHLKTRDIWEREQYALPLAGDETLVPAEDVPVDKGSFIVVAKQAYLNARATGKQGETLEYSGSAAQDVELSYIIHMQPDKYEEGAERKVTIHLSDGQGMSAMLFGTMRRLPGYPDDVAKYTQDAPYQQALDKHLK